MELLGVFGECVKRLCASARWPGALFLTCSVALCRQGVQAENSLTLNSVDAVRRLFANENAGLIA